jgi:hypothetical protein
VALLVLRRVGFVCRAKPNVPLVRLAKIVFKKVRWEKNKKHRVGLSVGLLAVPLQYGLYVLVTCQNGLSLF